MNIKEHYSQRSYGYYLWLINVVSATGLLLALLGIPKGLLLYGATLKYWYLFIGLSVFGLFVDDKRGLLICGLIGYAILFSAKYLMVYHANNVAIGAGA